MQNRAIIERVSEDAEQKPGQGRLTRADWLQKALEVLVASGVDAVRITRLAELLGVTRGSFYWHFSDRDGLLAAMLEVWRQQNTASITAAAQRPGGLEQQVLALFQVWLDPGLFDPELDLAVRDWARGDAALQQQITQADQQRLEALTAMFAGHGFTGQQAKIRARNLYYTQMGYFALHVTEPFAERLSYAATYFATYTDEELSAEAEQAFRQQIIARPELWGGEAIPEA